MDSGTVDRDGGVDDTAPRYRQVAADLRGLILDGRLAPEQNLPTQQSLRRRYGIGRGTVQSALQVLREEGLIEEGVPGRAARVARRGATLQPLGHHIARAFAARHVRLDVWALTAEQLSKAVQIQTEAIRAGEHRPESVAVRVLLPDLETRHPYPCRIGDPDDPRPLQRLRHVIRTYAGAMEHSLTALAEEHLVDDVRVEVRGVPTIPGEKRYIINGSEILTGFYQVRRSHMHNSADGSSLDVLELYSDGSLFPLVRGEAAGPVPDALDEARFEQIQQWFDTRWEYVARPLPLGA
ncbi:winged helix-turn-helix domain-containing protein [Streptomyces sp. DSM 42041]|uniref:Winged helix-turn-helix domain-containing protein n=1 Tax=Streptomyces hazeniae TaxID=3075538 RepID=A0ABU2NQW6_9ACTN|nr:winged helix-turn-helix domain-containing protein [Streptomyces sp. DSM 42041]MDT0378623.1 winged helix-turn-helix domain-containing protein [Streptomyces sp. DSM 42041]